MIVGVTGGREFTSRFIIWRALDDLHYGPEGPITDLVHGGARGVDAFADQWARARRDPDRWIRIHVFLPDYPRYGGAMAPKIRNQEMIDKGPRPDKCLEFPGGRGTADMVERWRKAGYRVYEVHGEGQIHEKPQDSQFGF